MPLSVITLYTKPSTLREWLTGYKGRDGTDEVPLVPDYLPIVRALLGRFFIEHGEALQRICGGFEEIAIVPSTSRQPPHPLSAVIESLELGVEACGLLERGTGDLGFRKPCADGYAATGHGRERRVLVVDDVYTTGARVNSAAVALERADHHVVGALAIARRINPEFSDLAKALWEQQSKATFDWQKSPVVAAAAS